MKKKILAIETSCDETAASLVEVEEQKDSWKIRILSSVVASQIDIHKKWGGVFPELASRAHLETIIPVLDEALIDNKLEEVDRLAVTSGPGLIGSLLMGIETANILSTIYAKKIVPVNHLEGHIYAAFAPESNSSSSFDLEIPKRNIFPILSLVVSGGHTSLILMKDHLKYEVVGQTIDDAAGEAFDKVAKIMDLGYPGGPIIENLASRGDENAINFPIAIRSSLDFSFSGLKTAVLYKTKDPSTGKKRTYNKADVAASFQKAVVDALIIKTNLAIDKYQPKTVVLSGGVSANGYLRNRFVKEIKNTSILIPPKKLSTDNAVGIAIAASLKKDKVDYVEAEPNLVLPK